VETSSGFLEPGIGGRRKRFMKEKIKYTDEPLGDMNVIHDFLPPPEDLVVRDEGVKITISLSRRSIEFFKGEAKKHDTQYQRMIRRLLDAYAEKFSQPKISRSSHSVNSSRR
jgi:predicted DNA binding CopG/RHH family protein